MNEKKKLIKIMFKSNERVISSNGYLKDWAKKRKF